MPAGKPPATQAVAMGTINPAPVQQCAPAGYPAHRQTCRNTGHRKHSAGRSRLNADKQSYRVAGLGRATHISSAKPNRRYSRSDRTSLFLDRHLTGP